jgi:polar amino acid transport system permease protein
MGPFSESRIMDISFAPLIENWRFIALGLWTTLYVSLLSMTGSMVVGAAVGLSRCYGPRWLKLGLVFYIDSMRAIPVLVVLIWMYFAFPLIIGTSLPPVTGAVFAITLHLAAYVAEIVRAGIESIRPGQVRAGLALGMSQSQLIRKIILPQAVVRMLPAFGSALGIAVKDTAIASVIAVPELIRQAETVAGLTYRPLEVYTVVMLLYFVLLFPISRGVDRFYQRVAHLGRS